LFREPESENGDAIIMKRTVLFALLLSAGLLSAKGSAESIFARHDRRAAYLFVDNRGRRVGDLVTLVINETTDIDQKENRKLDKSSASGANMNFATAYTDGSVGKAASGSLDGNTSSNRSFDGEANFRSQRDMTDRITCTIIDVMPNGNLFIQGERTRIISGEERTMRISGYIRPADINVANIIESKFLAKATVEYTGNGVDSRFVNQGWFSRAVNKIWPF
jgi:flagellar L-ring protein FlgH